MVLAVAVVVVVRRWKPTLIGCFLYYCVHRSQYSRFASDEPW